MNSRGAAVFARTIFSSCAAVVLLVVLASGSAFAEEKSLYKATCLSDSNAFSIIVVPDTQTYVKYERNQGILELMTGWISENLQTLNVLTVLQTGDLVEQNNIDKTRSRSGNQTSAQQWAAISHAFARLDGRIPYVLATGNHDYGIVSAENRETQFPKYFPTNRNSSWKDVLVECCPNFFGVKTLESAAYAFKTPQGGKLLVLSLEFAPSDSVLEWAKSLVARNTFNDHFVILLTHSFNDSLAKGNVRLVKEKYAVKDANYGQAVWDKLIYPSDNIRLVVSGHIAGTKDPRENIGFRADRNHAGKMVSQMLFDTQTDGGGWQGNGGDGWVRILEFSPDLNRVSVRTFSPLFAISPSMRHLAWRTEPYNEFVFEIGE